MRLGATWRSVLEIGQHSVEKCRKVSNMSKIAFRQRVSPDTRRLGLVSEDYEKRQAKACRHRRPPNCEGPNGVFRSVGVIRYSVALQNSARNRFPLTVTLNADLGQDSQDTSLS